MAIGRLADGTIAVIFVSLGSEAVSVISMRPASKNEMKGKPMKEFDPKHAKKQGYTKADWDAVDSPELTDDELATAQPLAEALPELAANMKRRGRPPLDTPKEAISIRLDADLLKALRGTGKGWQKGVNDMLRSAMRL